MTKRIAVILSGAGHFDGAELRESILSLLVLDQAGAQVTLFAPNREQFHVIDHLTGNPTQEKRNVLTEAARVGRGKVSDLAQLKAQDYDALVIPGGYGVAKNLSDFAFKGPASEVEPDFARTLKEFFSAKKPIAALCIAPAVVARVLGEYKVKLTIGNDPGTAQAVVACGAIHQDCAAHDFVVDQEHCLFTSPAYMYDDAPLRDIHLGIQGCLQAMLKTL